MNGDEVLEVLVRAGATVARTSAGQVVALGLPANLEHALAEHEVELALAVYGRATGHRWASCTACGRAQLIATGQAQACKLKAGCKGKLKAYARARAEGTPLLVDGSPVPCARPGCDRPATRRTAWHELVCSADFHHLALALPREDTPR